MVSILSFITILNSIELECINCALQNDIGDLKSQLQKAPNHYKEMKLLEEKHALLINEKDKAFKLKLKEKKDKYLGKFKEMESKFTEMCESKVRELEETWSNQYGAIISEKEDQIQQLLLKIQDEYVSVNEHEQIVNDSLNDQKQNHLKEIEDMWNQFEKEFINAQEEYDNQKDDIQKDLKDKIIQLEEEIKMHKDKFNIQNSEVGKIHRRYNEVNKQIEKFKAEIVSLNQTIKEQESKYNSTVKESEESIFRLKNDLNSNKNELNWVKSENSKLNSKLNDLEQSEKYNIGTLEKKLKQITVDSEAKIKHKVAENADLTQRIMRADEEAKLKAQESHHLSEECDRLHNENWKFVQEIDEMKSYIELLETKIKIYNSKRKVIVKTLMGQIASRGKFYVNMIYS